MRVPLVISIFLSVGLVHGDALTLPRSHRVLERSPVQTRDLAQANPKIHARNLHLTKLRAGSASTEPQPNQAGRVVALSAALGSLLQGYDTGVVGGALLFIVPEFGLAARPWIQGLIVTTSTVGSLAGTLIASKLSDAIGRKRALQFAGSLFVGASLLLAWSPVVEVLLLGRGLMGVAVGVASSTVPIYIAECAEAKNRGALATIPQLCISSGILLAYIVSLTVAVTTKGAWRLMMGCSLVPALLQAACVTLFLPESPRWLLRKHPSDPDRARTALARLRGVKEETPRPLSASEAGAPARASGVDLPPSVEAEFAALVQGVETESATKAVASSSQSSTTTTTEPRGNAVGWAALREPPIRKLVLVCMALQFFQQFSGVNAVVYFTPQTLKLAGVPALFGGLGLGDDASSLLATILTYSPKIPSLLLAMGLIDLWGRKKLLSTFVPGMAACLFTLAASFSGSVGMSSAMSGAVALGCLCLYGSFFVLSLGPIPNIITAELFPARCRSAAMACSLMSQFFFNTAVGLAFPVLRQRFGSASVFAGFGGVCVLAWLFSERFVPETKGRALEDLASSASASPPSPDQGTPNTK